MPTRVEWSIAQKKKRSHKKNKRDMISNALLLFLIFLQQARMGVFVAASDWAATFGDGGRVQVRFSATDGVFVRVFVGDKLLLDETELSSAALRRHELWLRPGDGGGMQLAAVQRAAGASRASAHPRSARSLLAATDTFLCVCLPPSSVRALLKLDPGRLSLCWESSIVAFRQRAAARADTWHSAALRAELDVGASSRIRWCTSLKVARSHLLFEQTFERQVPCKYSNWTEATKLACSHWPSFRIVDQGVAGHWFYGMFDSGTFSRSPRRDYEGGLAQGGVPLVLYDPHNLDSLVISPATAFKSSVLSTHGSAALVCFARKQKDDCTQIDQKFHMFPSLTSPSNFFFYYFHHCSYVLKLVTYTLCGEISFFFVCFSLSSCSFQSQVGGVAGTIQSIPAGHRTATVLVARRANSVTKALISWGDVLLKLAGAGKRRGVRQPWCSLPKRDTSAESSKRRRDTRGKTLKNSRQSHNSILDTLGYMTDNGAFYHTHPDPNTSSYYETMLLLRQSFAIQNIPVRYMQLDR